MLLNTDNKVEGVFELLNNNQPVREADLSGLIDRFRGILSLQNWRVRYKVVTDERLGRSLMMIKPNRDRQLATIYIRQSLLGQPTREVGPLLLHEMLHLVLEPMVEEHHWQLEYEIGEARAQEYEKRFVRCLEKVVELLSDNLAKLIDISDEASGDLKEAVLEGLKEVTADPAFAVRDFNDDDEEYLLDK